MAGQLTSEVPITQTVLDTVGTRERTRAHIVAAAMIRELPDEVVYLLPLRLFLGLGWLRAAVEKLVDPAWRNGSELQAFLSDHAQAGLTLPFYEPVAAVVDRFAGPVSVGVLMTEALIAGAVLIGFRTSAALLVALFLNVNFILAGQTNPSVFYMLVELVLLSAGAGAMCGLDGRRPGSGTRAALGCRPTQRRLLQIMAVSVVIAVALLPFGSTLAPADVIHDPALVLSLVAVLIAAGSGLRYLRTAPGTR